MASITLRQALEERAIRAAHRSLRAFTQMTWPVLNPGVQLVWGAVHDAMAEHLEAVVEGQVKRLLITVPPGHGKTTLASINLPLWWWLRKPELRVIGASYDLKLATRINVNRRDVVRSDRFRVLRPGFDLRVGQKGKTHFVNDRQGWMRAASTSTGITGEHADLAVIDDPLHADQVYGPELAGHVRWFREVLPTRFRDLRQARWVIVMQRLHEADLAGHVAEQPGVVHLNLPTEYDPARSSVTAIGWQDWRREKGQLLFPERFPREVIEQKKIDLGSAAYAAQYDQTPIVGEGNVFDRSWWRRYTLMPADKGAGLWVGSVDANYRAGEDGSYFVLQVWARFGADFYLVDELRKRLSIVQAVAAIEAWAQRYPLVADWLIEKKANGDGIIDMLRGRVPGIMPVDPRSSKQARAAACAPWIEEGRAFVPESHVADWIDDWIDEWAAFPRGRNDDRVDCGSQAMRHLGGGLLGATPSPADLDKPDPMAATEFSGGAWGGNTW